MLLAPAASAAVVKPAVPLLSAAVSSTLPLLTSVKVTEPDAVPLLALTCAVKVTQESWVTDVAEAVSVVLVASAACGTAAPAVPGRTAAAVPASRRPTATIRGQRITAASSEDGTHHDLVAKRCQHWSRGNDEPITTDRHPDRGVHVRPRTRDEWAGGAAPHLGA